MPPRPENPRDIFCTPAFWLRERLAPRNCNEAGPCPATFNRSKFVPRRVAAVSIADEGQFCEPANRAGESRSADRRGLSAASDRHSQTNGEEVYPTIELINRLYPPVGEELRFPVPIELTQEDLELALAGKFITRIIYLEDPRAAYARQEDPNFQYTVPAGPKDDPLVMADRLGRPMAILRIGGRVPVDVENPDPDFLYHSPALLRFQRPQNASPLLLPSFPQQQL